MRTAVFAYGSLVSAESIARTLGDSVGPPIPAELPGWRRRWSLVRDNLRCEKTFARADDGSVPPYVLGLNIEAAPDHGRGPNGALIKVDDHALARLDLRELRYDRVDVTEEAGAMAGFERVIAYTAKPENHATEPPRGAVILATYLQAVEKAFAGLGPDERDRFKATTGSPPVEVIEAVLVEDDIPPGNPRTW